MSKFCKLLKKLLLICLAFFAVTFAIYFFNLDMKLTAALQPLFEKWYDRLERDKRL